MSKPIQGAPADAGRAAAADAVEPVVSSKASIPSAGLAGSALYPNALACGECGTLHIAQRCDRPCICRCRNRDCGALLCTPSIRPTRRALKISELDEEMVLALKNATTEHLPSRASGIETEGQDRETGLGAEHKSPTEGDAQ